MAGKRARKPKQAGKVAPNRRVWSQGHHLQLLAYLNWCVQHELDFESTASSHLKSVTGKDFSQRQITDRLKRDWTAYGNCDKFEDLFSQGTAGLNPSDDEDQIIQQIFIGLGRPNVRYRLRSASSALHTWSPTLSADTVKDSQQSVNTGGLSQSVQPDLGDIVSDNEPGQDQPHDLVKGEEDSELSSILSFECSSPEHGSLSNTVERTSQELIITPSEVVDEATDLQAMRSELLKQQGYIFTLRNRLSETERELNDMRHCGRAANADQYHLRQQISNLQRKVEAKDRLLGYTSAIEMDSLGLSRGAIGPEYTPLYFGIDNTCSYICDMDPDGALLTQPSDFDQSAQTWSVTSSGWELDRLLSYSSRESIPNHKIFPSLMAAGIFELVFEPVFPEILALECPLLNQYRKHILTKDGHPTLHQLDLIALKSLTMEDHFRTEVIPQKAKTLAEFILRVLEHLLPPESRDISQDPRQEQHELAVGELENTLCQALTLKIELTLSVTGFKFIFFKPGDLFDATCMQPDSWHLANYQTRSQNAKPGVSSIEDPNGAICVKLCLFPALYALPSQKANEWFEDSALRFGTNYNKSVKKAAPEELNSLDLVAKAVVLV